MPRLVLLLLLAPPVLVSQPAHLVKDINTRTSSAGSSPSNFVQVRQNIFFVANDGIDGAELWLTDGTSGGTRLVRDILLGPALVAESEGKHEPAFYVSLGRAG